MNNDSRYILQLSMMPNMGLALKDTVQRVQVAHFPPKQSVVADRVMKAMNEAHKKEMSDGTPEAD